MSLSNAAGHPTTMDGGFDLRCLATDPNPNPDDYPDGQSLFEKDTFKVWFLDKDSGQWIRKNGEVRS